MRVLVNKWTGVAVYLASVCGICVFCMNLSGRVATQAIALALPYFPDQGPRQHSLVERRQIDAAQAAQPRPEGAEIKKAALTVPSTSPQILAAQLDLAEKEDLSVSQPTPRRFRYCSRRVPPPFSLSAADEFGRRFGVLTVASR